MRPSSYLRNSGVSLVEYVLGLAILAIVLVGVGLFFLSQPRQLDPVFQFRAVSLVEAVAEQVLAVKYDASNNPAAQERCGINGVTACQNSPQASAPGDVRNFEVVDDFQLWCGANAIDGQTLASDLGLSSPELYSRFGVATCVETPAPLAAGYDETDPALFMKKISINISIDQGDTLSFTLHRYNIR